MDNRRSDSIRGRFVDNRRSDSIREQYFVTKVSMSVNTNYALAIETAKLEFGTLFLTTYRLPDVDEVKNVIAVIGKTISEKKFQALKKIISEIEVQKNLLLFFSHNDFIGDFSQCVESFGKDTFPSDQRNSSLQFFFHYFDSDVLNYGEVECEDFVSSALTTVQFNEANAKRAMAAVKFLSQVKEHVQTLLTEKKLFSCAVDDVPCDVCVDIRDESDETVAKDEGIVVDYDTKHCSCYTYEVCGDCSCVDDDVFCHA